MSVRILTGDCRALLRELPDQSVQCIVTSPPYYGLRDYGVDGQIGLESSPEAFIEQMVAVFREVRRVLRDDGTLWLNIGDSYASGGGSGVQGTRGQRFDRRHTQETLLDQRHWPEASIKPKDLMGIPWMLAFALRADGWFLRSDIIWAKRNCMPESVTDRPTNAHEHVFLLTKQPRYFYDAEAIREEGAIPAGTRAAKGSNVRSDLKDVNGRPPEYWEYTGSRNAWNVWHLATKPFPEAHFATFPPELPERCIKAGTSERGCCPTCRAPWVRQTEKEVAFASGSGRAGRAPNGKMAAGAQAGSGEYDIRMGPVVSTHTTGWTPTCDCPPSGPIPCTVLDPFGGAGTTGLVADRLRRDAILLELNPEYAAMARRRIAGDAGLFAEVA